VRSCHASGNSLPRPVDCRVNDTDLHVIKYHTQQRSATSTALNSYHVSHAATAINS